MAHDVFISYSSKDKPIADAICATMEQNGVRCFIAPRDIRPGADWGESIIHGIAGSRVFVLVLSHFANASQQIKREVERAVNRGLPIIPYRIEDVMPEASLEYFLSTPHWLDAFTPPVEEHARDLTDTIKRILGEPVSEPSSRADRSSSAGAAAERQAETTLARSDAEAGPDGGRDRRCPDPCRTDHLPAPAADLCRKMAVDQYQLVGGRLGDFQPDHLGRDFHADHFRLGRDLHLQRRRGRSISGRIDGRRPWHGLARGA